MPDAVSDSSTLIHLSVLGRLGLLQEFYGHVLIPPAVWKEVVEEGQGRAGAAEVADAVQAGWLHIVTPTNEAVLRLLKRDLDDGEAETIALAVERQAVIVFLDETEARKIAEIYSLRKTGVIGLLVRAVAEGTCPSLRQELDRLRHNSGFGISEELYRQVLAAVGEDVKP